MLIDLQGAFLAPPEYDLVCLLRDGHVPLEETEVNALLERVRPQLPDSPDPESYARRFTLLTLTRVGKDLALYRYAAAVRDDRRYLAFVPNCVRYLQHAAERAADWDPRLARLAELIAALPREHALQEGSTPCGR